MRITDELNLTLWMPLRAEDPAVAARRVDAQEAAAPVRLLNVLDTDRDGWLDEDDLPYDQLRLLERARASEPVEKRAAEPPRPGPEAAAAAPAEVKAPPAQPAEAAPAEVAPHIDLLA